MKLNQFVSAIAVVMLFMFVAVPSAQAQDQVGNDEVCKNCSPSLSQIGIIPAWNCSTFVFTVNSSMNGRCERLGYDWEVQTDPGAQITNAGGQAMIRFSTSGEHTVCVTMTVGFDVNGDNIISLSEQCTVTRCIEVTVC